MKQFTNKEVIDLYSKLEQLNNLSGDIFAYKIIYNKRKIMELVEIYNEMIKPSKEFMEFERKREALCIEYSDKDETENPIIVNKTYLIQTHATIFNIEFEKLKSEYNDILMHRQEVLINSKKFLYLPSDITLKLINLSELPIDISVDQMDIIFDLIEENQ